MSLSPHVTPLGLVPERCFCPCDLEADLGEFKEDRSFTLLL